MVRLAAPLSPLILTHFLQFMLLILLGKHQLLTAARTYNLHDFPPGFIFGSSTSSYQIEGAAFEDGRKASIFDTYAHAGSVSENGDVAADGYHKYKEDVQLMVETGLNAYRFSISWSRLIPDGRGPVNPAGLKYYNDLIDELLRNGIQPHITLMHQDTPQVLEDEYDGFLSRRIIDDFTAYADVCFREFGDRVRHWSTVNQANIFIIGGYNTGNSPPARCSWPFGFNCSTGNSSTEPYIVGHNVLLAHASIAKLYREKYQAKQKGVVGFSIYAFHPIPYKNTTEDAAAARRAHDFLVGWFMDPLTFGDYPQIMKKNLGSRLPVFTPEESELVKGSSDFIGLNYYTVIRIQHDYTIQSNYFGDAQIKWISFNNSAPLGMNPFYSAPWGLQAVLKLFKEVYGNPSIYIYENGQLAEAGLDDKPRVKYLQTHIGALLGAVRRGSNTKGYFCWSLIDLYELLYGYKRSFGLYYTNFSDPNLTRLPKLSQRWYSSFLKGADVVADQELEDKPTILQNGPNIVQDYLASS